jgi:hypothetical protein
MFLKKPEHRSCVHRTPRTNRSRKRPCSRAPQVRFHYPPGRPRKRCDPTAHAKTRSPRSTQFAPGTWTRSTRLRASSRQLCWSRPTAVALASALDTPQRDFHLDISCAQNQPTFSQPQTWSKQSFLLGKSRENYVARVAVRASGSFNLQLESSVKGVSHKYCSRLQRGSGFGLKLVAPTRKEDENRGSLSLPGLNAGVSRNI